MTEDFAHLRARYADLLRRLLPYRPRSSFQHEIHTHRLDEGSPHVERVDGAYHYVVTERGSELQRRAAGSEDELLYWLVSDVTAGIAQELERRKWFRGRDSRRYWFRKDVELLTGLDPEWGRRKAQEYEDILSKYPFRD